MLYYYNFEQNVLLGKTIENSLMKGNNSSFLILINSLSMTGIDCKSSELCYSRAEISSPSLHTLPSILWIVYVIISSLLGYELGEAADFSLFCRELTFLNPTPPPF